MLKQSVSVDAGCFCRNSEKPRTRTRDKVCITNRFLYPKKNKAAGYPQPIFVMTYSILL